MPIVLGSGDVDVISFLLGEHDHAFGTLDTLVRLAFAPDRSFSWRESTGSGFDVGDPAVIAYHIFVGQAAVVGDPESGANTTAWRALWQVCGDIEFGDSVPGSTSPQLSAEKNRQIGGKCLLVFCCKNDEILECDVFDVTMVGDGKSVAGCI